MSSEISKVSGARGDLVSALVRFSSVLAEVTKAELPDAYKAADDFLTLADETRDRIRDRLLEMSQAEGAPEGDKGTKKVQVSGWDVRAIPTRTGIDPKKLEALLRRRGVDPGTVMDMTITYKVNESKMAAHADQVKLTPADLEAIRYEPSFRVSVTRGE